MKTAIITGGTSGIGLATAKIFLANDFNCALVGRSPARFEKVKSELGGSFEFIAADVRKVEDCDKIISRTVEIFGGVDVLINCAGIYHEGAITSTDEKIFDDIFSTNVKGTFFTARAAVAELIKTRGAIVKQGRSCRLHKVACVGVGELFYPRELRRARRYFDAADIESIKNFGRHD